MPLIIFTVFSYTPDFLLRLSQPFIYDAKKKIYFGCNLRGNSVPRINTRINIILEIHYFNEDI